MDNENNYYQSQPNGMSTASMVLGIISLVSSCCLYISIPAGAVGIILALLSKGADTNMGSRAKTGLITSILGLVITITLIIVAFFSLNSMGNTKLNVLFDDYMDFYGEEDQVTPRDYEDEQNPGNLEEWFRNYMNGEGYDTAPVPKDAV